MLFRSPSAAASGQWEYTRADGTTYVAFGDIAGLTLGAGLNTRVTLLASAPTAIANAALSTTQSSLLLSLSGIVSTTTTAVFLRGTCFDSAQNSLGTSGEPFPGIAFYRDSSTVTPAAVAKIYAEFVSTVPERPHMVLCPVSNAEIGRAHV